MTIAVNSLFLYVPYGRELRFNALKKLLGDFLVALFEGLRQQLAGEHLSAGLPP